MSHRQTGTAKGEGKKRHTVGRCLPRSNVDRATPSPLRDHILLSDEPLRIYAGPSPRRLSGFRVTDTHACLWENPPMMRITVLTRNIRHSEELKESL